MHNALESSMSDNMESPDVHFLRVQRSVFKHMMMKEGISDVRKFIIDNAHLFRYFATHLPDNLMDSWEHAEQNEDAHEKLEAQYEIFQKQVLEHIENLDPEIQQGLAEAINDSDVDTTAYILETVLGGQTPQ